MNTNNKTFRYHLLAILTVIIWGTTFVSTKVLIGNGLTPVEIMLYRFALAYLGIWFVCPRKLFAQSWKDELWFVGAGLCEGSLYFVSENTALGITLASNVSLIVCTSPILTAFLSRFFNKGDKLPNHLIYGSLMALLGVALVAFNGSFILQINPLGDILTLFAALSWAFYGLILRRLGGRYPTLFITRKVFFYGVITLVPFLLASSFEPQPEVLMQPGVIINLLFLSIVASLLCFIMWNASVKELGVVRTTNYIYMVPLVTLLTSAIAIDEVITVIALIGSVFILSGVYVAEKGFKFK